MRDMKEKLLREYVRRMITLENSTPRKTITVGDVSCDVEVANNDSSRAAGLMDRKNMPEGTGMLFIYPQPMRLSFWMKNTHIPLDIAFIEEGGMIVQIAHLEPFDESPVGSLSSRCIAALEVPRGWFLKNKIDTGSFIS